MSSRLVIGIAGATVLGLLATTSPASGARARPSAWHQGLVTSQDIASQPGSEPGTVAEPDIAVNPRSERNAVAAAQDSRFPDGGAVAISISWTKDGGRHWHHRPAPGVTTATGGTFERASDPVVAFGPDGTAYLSLIGFNECESAVLVLRSTDGGVHWSPPVAVHSNPTCKVFDDKNWLIVDIGTHSPHRGRLYQFWGSVEFADDEGTQFLGEPQVVRWSDDRGATWSATSYVSPPGTSTLNSQPMIRADGSIVDAFYDFPTEGRASEIAPQVAPEASSRLQHERQRQRQRAAASSAPIDASGTIVAVTSTDGGQTWSEASEITNLGGGYADDVRCCLFSANIDAVTGRMHVAWLGGVGDTDPVYQSYSNDGVLWSSPVRVSAGDFSGVQNVNVDVSAWGGKVYVSYGRRTRPAQHGGYVRQHVVVSTDRGRHFGTPRRIGPVSALKYAAQAGAPFPGDYIGTAISRNLLYIAWPVSSKPPRSSSSKYHQAIWGATLRR